VPPRRGAGTPGAAESWSAGEREVSRTRLRGCGSRRRRWRWPSEEACRRGNGQREEAGRMRKLEGQERGCRRG